MKTSNYFTISPFFKDRSREYKAYRELQATNEYLLKVVFINTKYFFHNTNGQLKTGKTGTHSSADTSSVRSVFPDQTNYKGRLGSMPREVLFNILC